jgi:hypothetical protein
MANLFFGEAAITSHVFSAHASKDQAAGETDQIHLYPPGIATVTF